MILSLFSIKFIKFINERLDDKVKTNIYRLIFYYLFEFYAYNIPFWVIYYILNLLQVTIFLTL